ncbi:hypothetical protein EV200_102383 [Pedobacter psychrotolerans]|uniref:Uncharacterized protein n=1 Tax=Pedobacter psychrotolerans TaxID=1843235 RepID=A0A4R2HME6_9SPHI|nr:hypothetical protein EV200_102383 [Pedobacter psychrotolerans]
MSLLRRLKKPSRNDDVGEELLVMMTPLEFSALVSSLLIVLCKSFILNNNA